MYVLGINAMYHESAACLLRDGELIAMAEEERFNRVKHAKKPRLDNPDQMPIRSIRYCLAQGGIELADVNQAGYSSDPAWLEHSPIRDEDMVAFVENVQNAPARLAALGFRGQFHWVNHHDAHAASAYYASDFEDAAVLTIDGIGDGNSTACYHGLGTRLRLVQEVQAPSSIGFLWELVSMLLGFDIYDACKVMGLSAYGDPRRYAEQFRRLIRPTAGGGFETDERLLRFSDLNYLVPSGYFRGLEALFGVRRRQRGEELTAQHLDIAAALQQATDDIVLHVVRHLHAATGSANLCLAGGVALNCVTNTRVFEEGPFRRLHVQPAAHDAGTAQGTAWYIYHHLLGHGRKAPPTHAYWGPEFSQRQLEHALQDHQLAYTRSDSVEQEVARLLAEGHIVAFFQGRMEMGPRALGNRSLLADPRNPHMRDVLNHKVKHREYFRPFAPSVLHEEAAGWFRIGKETSAAEFMLLAYPVHEHLRERIPAVVHVDGTSRIQAVRRDVNPRYHRLISAFFELTGVPMVLNTSFNDSEPIVCTPEDAIATFLKTEIDYLVLGDFIVSKSINRDVVKRWRRDHLPALHEMNDRLLRNYRATQLGGSVLLTDKIDCPRGDAVPALFPEHEFILDELPAERVKGANVLEINPRCGALSIALAKAGARRITAVEPNPRARLVAGYNAVLNGCIDRLTVLDGGDDPFTAVRGERFDCIAAVVALTPSAADSYGLGALERILHALDAHLGEQGYAQIVATVPGTETGPTILLDLIPRHLGGSALVKVNPEPGNFLALVDWLYDSGELPGPQARAIKRRALEEGVTSLYLCLLHYEKSQPSLSVVPSEKVYKEWYSPLSSILQG
jgi:carbamoyltransferase